ncbi:MAG TPA: hypothetical protein VNV66_08710, partial [Pilimelia sp.]|nr:hypothetical protein [Pilimelia sp.]
PHPTWLADREPIDRYADAPDRSGTVARQAGPHRRDPAADRHPAPSPVGPGAARPVSGGRLVDAVTGAKRGPTSRHRSGSADEEAESDPGGYLAATLYTVMWYAVPMVLWVLYGVTLNREAAAASCTDELLPCEPPRSGVLDHVWEKLPVLGATLAVSVLVALLLRRLSGTWKATTVGFAAAAVGGGLATVGFSVITGQPLG